MESNQGPQDADGKATSEQNQAEAPELAGTNEVQQLKAELEKAKKDLLYLAAEFENYKKNMFKERSDLRKYGAERLAVDLLNVLDIFDTALNTEIKPETVADFKKGIEMTANELRTVLNRHGVEEIHSHGQPFNPSHHEAISSEPTEEHPEGHVSRVFKKPYKLHDKVIRPGQVVVATKKT